MNTIEELNTEPPPAIGHLAAAPLTVDNGRIFYMAFDSVKSRRPAKQAAAGRGT